MLRRVRMESFIKGIFMFLAITIVMLIFGTRLYQGYEYKYSSVMRAASRLKREIEESTDVNAQNRMINELRVMMVNVKDNTAPDSVSLTVPGSEERFYVVNRGRIFADLIEEERYMLLVGILGLLVAVELAIFLAYFITGPMRNLAWGCKEIGKGRNIRIVQGSLTPYELHELTNSFNEMASQLEFWRNVQSQINRMDRLAALGEMMSGLSHEIRNPLASMSIRLDLLRQNLHLLADKEKRSVNVTESLEHTEVLQGEIDRLNTTVSKLLSFVRIQEPLRTLVDLNEAAKWCRIMFQTQADEDGIALETELCREKPVVMADRDQIQQMLMNLMLNALQALSPLQPEGKNVLKQRRRVLIRTAISESGLDAKRGCEISISDNGPGIAEDFKERIFDPFFTTRNEGTGLGLSIVNRIVSAHGGNIFINSSENGTEFRIILPLADSAAALSEEEK